MTNPTGALLALVLLAGSAGAAQAAVTLTGTGVHSNNFDTLASTGQTNSGGLAGWEFQELGTSGNNTYFATNGGENSGNTFSLGATGDTDRAFGGLTHDNAALLQPLLGVQLVNQTGMTITGFTITYVGEQWRLGQISRGADPPGLRLSAGRRRAEHRDVRRRQHPGLCRAQHHRRPDPQRQPGPEPRHDQRVDHRPQHRAGRNPDAALERLRRPARERRPGGRRRPGHRRLRLHPHPRGRARARHLGDDDLRLRHGGRRPAPPQRIARRLIPATLP